MIIILHFFYLICEMGKKKINGVRAPEECPSRNKKGFALFTVTEANRGECTSDARKTVLAEKGTSTNRIDHFKSGKQQPFFRQCEGTWAHMSSVKSPIWLISSYCNTLLLGANLQTLWYATKNTTSFIRQVEFPSFSFSLLKKLCLN